MKKKRKMNQQDRELIQKHNEMKNGIKLGVRKEENKGYVDTPLFRPEQKTLFEK